MTVKEFESFMLLHQDRFYRYTFFFLRHHEESRDTLQEALIDLWKMRTRLPSYNHPEALALVIIRNKCISKMRMSFRRGSIEQELKRQMTDFTTETPATILEWKNDQEIVEQIIAQFPPEQQEILYLKNVEGLTADRISEMLGIRVNTIEVILSRARKAIRTKFELIQHYESK